MSEKSGELFRMNRISKKVRIKLQVDISTETKVLKWEGYVLGLLREGMGDCDSNCSSFGWSLQGSH